MFTLRQISHRVDMSRHELVVLENTHAVFVTCQSALQFPSISMQLDAVLVCKVCRCLLWVPVCIDVLGLVRLPPTKFSEFLESCEMILTVT